MGNNKFHEQKSWRIVIGLGIVLISFIILHDIVREVIFIRNEVSTLRDSLYDQVEYELESEVESSVSELLVFYDDYEDLILEEQSHILENVTFSIEQSIILADSPTEDEIMDIIISNVEGYREVHSDTDVYVVNSDSVMIYDGGLGEEVFIDLSGELDSFNRDFITDMITLTDNSDDYGLINFFFNDDVITQKTFICQRITNTDYYIYTVSDYNTVMDELLTQYSNDLHQFYLDEVRTLVLLQTDGTIYLHKSKNLMGQNIDNINDTVIYNSLTKVLNEAVENQYGYVTVKSKVTIDSDETTDAMVYYRYVEELDLVVMYSKDTSTYDNIIKDLRRENLITSLSIIVPLYLIVAGLLYYIVRAIIDNTLQSINMVNEEQELYHKFADITDEIILITKKNGDIIFSNELGKKTIFKENDSELNLDDIMVDEEGFKVLVGVNSNLYIKFTVSNVMYHGEECDLYVFTDVTEKVTTEQKLEAMTLSDDLTGLGNRRMLVRDYQDFVLPHVKNGNNAYLAMIDLDNFKTANDNYGHSYGDEVLEIISNIFKKEVNDDVKIYRVGGDEFAFVAINRTENECLKILRKMKNKIATYKYSNPLHISFSAGIIEINIKDAKRRLSDYYNKADELLYVAKEEGKDRIAK